MPPTSVNHTVKFGDFYQPEKEIKQYFDFLHNFEDKRNSFK